MQIIQNGRTEFSLPWTWFKFGKHAKNNIHSVYNLQKEYVTKFNNVISKWVCNLSFVRQYKNQMTKWVRHVDNKIHNKQRDNAIDTGNVIEDNPQYYLLNKRRCNDE